MISAFPQNELPLILASGSPRRSQLLKQLGYSFEVKSADLPEQRLPGEDPKLFVQRLAGEKAQWVSQQRPEAAVLGYDTVVLLDGEVLGKPRSTEDARRILRTLAARTHTVWSGAALARQGRIVQALATKSEVTFREYGEEEIEYQIATGEPFDKAGAYGIQSAGARLVQSISGCFYNIVGLPIFATIELIDRAGCKNE